MQTNIILNGDALKHLKELPSESIDSVMTSPPYWNLRDYSVEGQLGLEETFEQYIMKLCDIFDEIKRVLKKEGTCWVNLGDTYSNSGKGGDSERTYAKRHTEFGKISDIRRHGKPTRVKSLPPKSLCNIPARFSIEMQNRGWILRNNIIWHKPNVMPSSVKDRFTVDFEYLFFFVKSKKYFFEAQYEPIISVNDKRVDKGREEHIGKSSEGKYGMNATVINSYGRNKRCVWKITTKPFSEAHFATYPEELCETPIKAGCPEFICNKCGKAREKILEPTQEYSKFLGKGWHDHLEDSKMGMGQQTRGFSSRKRDVSGIKKYNEKGYTDCGCNVGFSSGIVLDPFFGAGTTGLVALKQNKRFIGIELNPEYIKIANERLNPYLEQTDLEQFIN